MQYLELDFHKLEYFAYNIHDRQNTFELTNLFIFSRVPSRVPMMALFKYFKRSNPLPLPEGPLSMKVA